MPATRLDNRIETVLTALRQTAIMRSKDLTELGISREYLRRLHQRGVVRRISRGLYSLADAEVSAQHTLVEATKRIPQGVICLLSALRFHGVTTQAPFEVWMAIAVKAWTPKITGLPLRVVRFSGPAFREGVETHVVEGVPLRVYSLAKTVADCFKYRHKIGLEVALEALREVLRTRQVSVDELWHFAHICRVANVMRPYLEALV